MVLVGKPERKGAIGRPRCRWEDNIITYFQEGDGTWTGLIWRRLITCGALV
jgi:hypothetical protein